jgi:hypothetical protein
VLDFSVGPNTQALLSKQGILHNQQRADHDRSSSDSWSQCALFPGAQPAYRTWNGQACDAAFRTAPDEENAHPTKSRKAHVIEHFASLGLRLSTAERTEALHWCLIEVRVDDYARSGAVGQGRRRPCKRQPHQRFVRKRVREYCEQGIFCNFGLAGLGIGLSTPSTRDVSQGSPFVDCWPLFTANGWAGGERCMQEAARLGFDRTGVLPSLWFQPRAYRKALPSDSSKLQAGPPGRGCSRFYCSRCWTL